jgi:hypothetical protein
MVRRGSRFLCTTGCADGKDLSPADCELVVTIVAPVVAGNDAMQPDAVVRQSLASRAQRSTAYA